MKTQRILNLIKRFLERHWQKWTILAIGAIVVYIGAIFYLCVYRSISQPQDIVPQKLEIDKQLYQEIMDTYNQQEQIVNEILNKDYPDVFK